MVPRFQCVLALVSCLLLSPFAMLSLRLPSARLIDGMIDIEWLLRSFKMFQVCQELLSTLVSGHWLRPGVVRWRPGIMRKKRDWDRQDRREHRGQFSGAGGCRGEFGAGVYGGRPGAGGGRADGRVAIGE